MKNQRKKDFKYLQEQVHKSMNITDYNSIKPKYSIEQNKSTKLNKTNDNLNYSFQDEIKMDSAKQVEKELVNKPKSQENEIYQKMIKIQNMLEKLISLQMANEQNNKQTNRKISNLQKKIDKILNMNQTKQNYLQNIKQNININLSQNLCEKNRSVSGVQTSKVLKNFFNQQAQPYKLTRLQSNQKNKSLMSIQQRKRMIDKEIQKRLRQETQKRKKNVGDQRKINSIQKYN